MIDQPNPTVLTVRGLTAAEARQRLAQYGSNALETAHDESLLLIFVRQFKSLIVAILALAGGVSFVLGDTVEAIAIGVVLAINALMGFVLEWNASRSMQALRRFDVAIARVVRDGQVQAIPSDQITVGDLLLVEAGEVVVADAHLIEVHQLEVDESTLTGESLPVSKTTQPTSTNAPLGDQVDRLFKGTAITAGTGRAVVTAVGGRTELGKIARLVQQADRTATPLEEKLDALSKVLIGVTLGLAGLFVGAGLVRGEALEPLIKTSVALAIAAIPEGLSVVATLALAYGMLRLARKKVLVKRLTAVETLGNTNVIFTDKTGTLTENRIDVFSLQLLGESADTYAEVRADHRRRVLEVTKGEATLPEQDAFVRLVRLGVLCNNADALPEPNAFFGDPVEVALLQFALSGGHRPETIRTLYPRLAEQPFSSDTRLMATLHRGDGGYLVAVKGAAEEVMARCPALTPAERTRQQQRAEQMATDGLRTLAFAYWTTAKQLDPDTFAQTDLTFVGLIGFLDPPRLSVTPALQACRTAGIRVVMVTGDHPATALTIARQVGLVKPTDTLALTGQDLKPVAEMSENEQRKLLQCNVFARVSPAQKLDLITMYQQQGNVVGMTGDGVNDAPALKKADIGIAMGLRGTQVAAEAADLVLKDDSFASIVRAVAQGRVIFGNIRKFVSFLLACNLSEIFVVALAGLAGLGNPLLPLQILFINIVTDVFPALALGLGRENGTLMQRPPRPPGSPLLSRTDWGRVVGYALLMTASVLGAYGYAREQWGYSATQGSTLTFYALSWVQLLHVFNLYSGRGASLLRNEITRNHYIWLALLLCVGILVSTYFIPMLHQVLSLQSLDSRALGLIAGAGLVPVGVSWLVRRLYTL